MTRTPLPLNDFERDEDFNLEFSRRERRVRWAGLAGELKEFDLSEDALTGRLDPDNLGERI